jgi:hypothetical protein
MEYRVLSSHVKRHQQQWKGPYHLIRPGVGGVEGLFYFYLKEYLEE